MRDCYVKKKAELIKTSKAKDFGNFAVDKKQHKPMDDKNINEVGF